MKEIGFLHFRSVDAFRYNIYHDYEGYYYVYKNKPYRIKSLALKSGGNIIILSNDLNYNDFIINLKNNFDYIYINHVKIKNENYIELPKEYISNYLK